MKKEITIKGEKYIIREDMFDFQLYPAEFDETNVIDARKIKIFSKRNGFESTEDVIEYIEKYF